MLVVYRNFLGESHPAAGERSEGVFGGRGERVDGARSESGAAREQAVVGEGVEGFSQYRRGVHDDLLQRVHRRGACLHRGIQRDLQLAHHLDGAVRSLGDGRRLTRLCLPKTSSPHYVHWALLGISRRPASITGHADRLSRTVHRVGLRPAEPGGAPD